MFNGTNRPLTIKQIVKKFYNFKNRTKELNKISRSTKNKKSKGEIKYQFMDFPNYIDILNGNLNFHSMIL